MNTKTGKKMKGLMCHSTASTAVRMSQHYQSIILPQRRPGTAPKYVRLGHHQPSSLGRSSYPSSSSKNDQEKVPQEAVTTASQAISDSNFLQVVVMRVSIHCQGCAGKVKKHLSKMAGVSSFSIDLESKRVIVMGHVSPSGVLESISKVKKAEFWP